MGDEFKRASAALSGNLVRLRTAKGISQEALALEAGVDRTFVSKIERGVANPSLATICALAETLRTTVSLLVSPTR